MGRYRHLSAIYNTETQGDDKEKCAEVSRWQIVAKVEEGITSAKIIFSSRIPESASIGGAYFNRVGEFFHRINSSQIEVGNFELDYNRGLAYCRTSIKINPMIINSEEVIEYLINDLLYDNIRLMNQYLDGIKAVA